MRGSDAAVALSTAAGGRSAGRVMNRVRRGAVCGDSIASAGAAINQLSNVIIYGGAPRGRGRGGGCDNRRGSLLGKRYLIVQCSWSTEHS